MKKMKRVHIKTLLLFLFVAFFTAFLLHHPGQKEELYLVKRVIDGDTILLANGERVRYIGINTPETKHPYKPVERFGEEASQYNKKLVSGKWVKLEFDAQRKDRYGRLLAYVYTDGLFINAKLVEDGYAQVYTVPPNVKYQEEFLRLQLKARKERRGLWGAP
ncbi:MAG: thermonuclease family protein [Candidatus Omnitrophica bacterium]|nr:thermonuclease family protein [Candidatus Omnitrophota bacterium]